MRISRRETSRCGANAPPVQEEVLQTVLRRCDVGDRGKTLNKAARTLATEQLDRLEGALISHRLWSAPEFARLFQTHPLLREMGRRLLWYTHEAVPRHFRLTEDFRTVDLQKEPIELNEPSSVRLAHPMHPDANELAALVQQWTDYELLQPFEQLARRVYRQEPDTPQVRADVPSVRNQPVGAGSLLGLIQQGWAKLQDGAHICGLRWDVPGGGSATLMLHDGLNAATPLAVPVLRIRSLTLEPALGALACSEVLRTVDRLAMASTAHRNNLSPHRLQQQHQCRQRGREPRALLAA